MAAVGHLALGSLGLVRAAGAIFLQKRGLWLGNKRRGGLRLPCEPQGSAGIPGPVRVVSHGSRRRQPPEFLLASVCYDTAVPPDGAARRTDRSCRMKPTFKNTHLAVEELLREPPAPPAPEVPYLGPATVAAVSYQQVELDHPGGRCTARIAVAQSYAPVVGDTVLAISRGTEWYVIGVLEGTGTTTFTAPGDIAVLDDGSLILVDGASVVRLEVAGDALRETARLTQWGQGSGDQFGQTLRLAADGKHLLVIDTDRQRVLLFDAASFKPLAAFGATDQAGSGANQFDRPGSVALSGDRAIVADVNNQRIVKLRVK